LGTLYARGEGVSRDFDQAAALLRKAAAQGHPQAQANLGLLLLNRARTRAEWGEAKKWLSAAPLRAAYTRKRQCSSWHSRIPASIGD
jgi:TPR repeat protein